MKRASKWIVTHEPLIFAGLFFGVATFLAIRYGTRADSVIQAQSGGLVALAFGFLRNFVTPSGRKTLDAGQANLPAVTSDLDQLYDFLGEAIHSPKTLPQLLTDHRESLLAEVKDLIERGKTILHPLPPTTTVGQMGPTSGSIVTIQQDPSAKAGASVPMFDPPAEATTPASAPDHLAELAAMLK